MSHKTQNDSIRSDSYVSCLAPGSMFEDCDVTEHSPNNRRKHTLQKTFEQVRGQQAYAIKLTFTSCPVVAGCP